MEKGYAKAGIATYHGRTRFLDRMTLQVGDDTLTGRFVLIASGAMPAILGIPGEANLMRSDQFLELEQLPKRIIFVGGSYISFEFAHVSAHAGSLVEILHREARWLEPFGAGLVRHFVK